MRAAVIGKDGRTTALVRTLEKSPQIERPVRNLSSGKIGLTAKSLAKAQEELRRNATRFKPDFVVVGPEEPLAAGFVDLLRDELRIPCVGPTRKLAKLEASKVYTRQLLEKHDIGGNPKFRVFTGLDGVESYLDELEHFVIKPDGLTGGKGVKVSDVHLFSLSEAVDYCRELFSSGQRSVLIEEKLDGEEFSLQSFCDGKTVAHMPIVQDHKRVGIGDTGPNTGGMGSYSDRDGSLPFLRRSDVDDAQATNENVIAALIRDVGEPYKGILYGGFIATADGIRLIEYNVRFGDPEALNILSILETDFAAVCESIINGTLDRVRLSFAQRATVCKYIVPQNYPENPAAGSEIIISAIRNSENLQVFEAAIDERDSKKYLTGSRAVAVVGIADELEQAECIAERAAASIKGPVYHRSDIGSRELIETKIAHMRKLRSRETVSSAVIE